MKSAQAKAGDVQNEAHSLAPTYIRTYLHCSIMLYLLGFVYIHKLHMFRTHSIYLTYVLQGRAEPPRLPTYICTLYVCGYPAASECNIRTMLGDK